MPEADSENLVIESAENVPQVRPWVRYWARMLDMFIFSLPIGFLCSVIAPDFILQQGSEHILSIVMLFIWVVIEPALLARFGTTPGKWFFKIRLCLSSGEPISYAAALDRSIKIWWRGFGVGIPLVSPVTLVVAYQRLMQNLTTSWDREGGFVVTHEKIGNERVVAATIVLAILIFMAIGSVPDTTQ